METMSPQKLEEFQMQRAAKKSKKTAAKEEKRLQDEAASVSTSAALVRGQISDPARVEIPPTMEGEIVSTPTTMGVNVVPSEATGASPHLTDASDE